MSLGCSCDFITCQLAEHSMLIYLYFILECIAPARLTRVIAQVVWCKKCLVSNVSGVKGFFGVKGFWCKSFLV